MPRSPSRRDAASPERELRLGEQRDLSRLNMQLENYVLTIRQREAELREMIANGEIMTITTHEEHTSRIRKEYEAKVRSLFDELNRSIVEVEDLKRKLRREVTKNEELISNIEQLEQVRDDLQDRIAKTSHDLDMLESKYHKDVAAIDSLKSQLEALKKNEDSVQDELEKLRQENRDLDSRVNQERELRISAEEDLKIARANLDRERKGLLKRMEELAGGADDIEQEIRSKLQDELKRKLAEFREEMQNAHDDIVRKQLEDFNRQFEEFRAQEAMLIAERDELRGKLERASSSSFHNSKERAELEKKISDLERKLAAMVDELQNETSRHNHTVTTKDAEIARLLAKLNEVRAERNILFHLGVGLKNSVEAYEDIVTAEEERLAKRHKVSQSPASKPASVRTAIVKAKDISPANQSPKKPAVVTKVVLGGKRKAMGS
eukprot:TRINITY_DN509_c0_g1_i1.p1 TRINITY_DN509_c0_g1~~TRINITY_DN509_c0_g1_i1.p1  ORF type:complete len:436 (-),score=142.83 TRINITY_DN509_c0_g1_i1:146-1453(-)